MVLLPLGSPKTSIRQGVFGDIGDHSWEGCSPFSPVGPAQNPHGPVLSQALTISQPPPLGYTNHLVPSPLPRPPPWAASPQTWTLGPGPSCLKVPPPCPTLLPPGAFNKGWYFPGKPPGCGAPGETSLCPLLSCLTRSPGLQPLLFFFSQEADAQLLVTGRVAGPLPQFTLFLRTVPHPPGPANVPQPLCRVTAAPLGRGLVVTGRAPLENQTGSGHLSPCGEHLSLQP